MSTRIEQDSMGAMPVPEEALYGASTARAVLNFPVSGRVVPPAVIHAYGWIKWAAARANADLGLLPEDKAGLILQAAQEVAQGALDRHFVVDIYQTGSGTSTHMNVNEVIANRAAQLAGMPVGRKEPVHPNDHVNLGQSSNDTFPSALHVAVAGALDAGLKPALDSLRGVLQDRAHAFRDVLKIGRTHLMDATPMRLGQEFLGWAGQMEQGAGRVMRAVEALLELPLGGTAVGTGLNRHPELPQRAIALLAEKTGLPFRPARNAFEAQAARDGLVEASGHLKTIAVSLFKIANDIRWLGSGPRAALGEIALPAVQPGSSIMPGKVNPVHCESLMQVCARVFGNDATATWCAGQGNLELNVMMPLLGTVVLESVELLAASVRLFAERCVAGITANDERCRGFIEQSLAMVTGLNALIGYDRAAALARESMETGRTIRSLCAGRLDDLGITATQLDEALDPARMAGPL